MSDLVGAAESDQIVVACEVPEGAIPGSTFHVQLGDRFFEVITPDDATPGQTINIVVPAEQSVVSVTPDEKSPNAGERSVVCDYPEELSSMVDMGFDPDTAARALNSTRGNREAATAILLGEASQDSTVATSDPNAGLLGSLRTIGGKALAHAKSLDDKYKITDKVVEVTTPAIEKMKSVDEKYQISERAIAAGEKAKARITEIDEKYMISANTSAIIAAGAEKIRSLDETHKLSEKVAGVGEVIATYAREIDSRYAVSATVGRIVESGAMLVIAALNKASEVNERHRILERTGEALASGTEAVVGTVQRFTSSSTPSATAEVEVLEPVTTTPDNASSKSPEAATGAEN